MLLSRKKQVVFELEEVFRANSTVLIVHYHGLTVQKINALRQELKKTSSNFKVVKNTLASIAANNVGISDLSQMLKGPVGIAYSNDVISVTKILSNFAANNNNLKLIGGIVENSLVDSNYINEISKLPSMDELRAKIVMLLQAPCSKFVRVINEPLSQIVRLINNKK